MIKKRKNMVKEFKDIPTFKNEDEEREFWANQDSTEYVDWDEAELVVPDVALLLKVLEQFFHG